MNPLRPTCLGLLLPLALALPLAAQEATDPGAEASDIGYPTVEAARSALLARDDIRMSRADGWLSIEDPANLAIWTFAPEDDPAHPAVVRRTVLERDGQVVIRMDIRCEGAPAACDALEEHFLSLNAGAGEALPAAGDADPTR